MINGSIARVLLFVMLCLNPKLSAQDISDSSATAVTVAGIVTAGMLSGYAIRAVYDSFKKINDCYVDREKMEGLRRKYHNQSSCPSESEAREDLRQILNSNKSCFDNAFNQELVTLQETVNAVLQKTSQEAVRARLHDLQIKYASSALDSVDLENDYEILSTLPIEKLDEQALILRRQLLQAIESMKQAQQLKSAQLLHNQQKQSCLARMSQANELYVFEGKNIQLNQELIRKKGLSLFAGVSPTPLHAYLQQVINTFESLKAIDISILDAQETQKLQELIKRTQNVREAIAVGLYSDLQKELQEQQRSQLVLAQIQAQQAKSNSFEKMWLKIHETLASIESFSSTQASQIKSVINTYRETIDTKLDQMNQILAKREHQLDAALKEQTVMIQDQKQLLVHLDKTLHVSVLELKDIKKTYQSLAAHNQASSKINEKLIKNIEQVEDKIALLEQRLTLLQAVIASKTSEGGQQHLPSAPPEGY